MLVLYYTAILIAILVIIDFFINDKNIKFILVFIVSIILICISGFKRIGVGFDDFGYIDIFYNVQSILKETILPMERGYILQNLIVSYISHNSQVLLISNALVSISILSYVCYKVSPYPVMSLYLYFVHFFLYKDLTQFRNAISSSILMLMVYFFSNRRYFFCILSYFSSTLYHIVSSISIFPILSLSVFKKNVKTLSLALFISGIIVYLASKKLPIIDLLSIGYFPYIQQKYFDYIVSQYVTQIHLLDLNNIRLFVIWVIGLFFFNRLSFKSKYFIPIFIFFSFGIFLRYALLDYGIFSARTASFFTQFDILLLGIYTKLVKNYLFKILVATLILIYGFIIMYYNLNFLEIINDYENILF
ncbi:MAG: EpsG family protein [Elusimicrobiales bacterium]|nr:EpsG family protein [Elusimicrobiales bacterium]